jgi:hypothetical protein
VFGVESELSTVHFPLGQWIVDFPYKFFFGGEVRGWGFIAKISLSMFFSEFPIASHFYPICFGKCYPPFTYIVGPR